MRVRMLAALIVTPALALGPDQGPVIRTDDRDRLAQLDAVAGRALREAIQSGAPVDRSILFAGLTGAPLPKDQATQILPGDWSCQMLKLGGNLPLVVYQPFRCRIGPDGRFDKLTGSQLMTGQIGTLDGAQVYLGTGYIAGDPALPYADLPDDIDTTATPQRTPDVGVVEVTSTASARIILPLPMLESDLNILLLTR